MIQVGSLLLLCIAVVTANPPPAPTPPAPVPGPPAPAPPAPGQPPVAPVPPAAPNPPCVALCKPVSGFDLAKLEGTWLEVSKISSTPGREGKCESATYTVNEDKTLSVDLNWIDNSGKPQKLSGTIKTSGPTPADGQVTFQYKDKSEMYIIFYINYDKMFAVYTCIDQKAYVFVLSKTQPVDDSALVDLNAAMTANGMQPTWIKPVTRTGCPASY